MPVDARPWGTAHSPLSEPCLRLWLCSCRTPRFCFLKYEQTEPWLLPPVLAAMQRRVRRSRHRSNVPSAASCPLALQSVFADDVSKVTHDVC